jgi:molybdopterin molybdotransferase
MPPESSAAGCADGRLTPLGAAFGAIVGLGEAVREAETLPLLAAVGRVAAVPVVSGLSLPPFDHTAVDGYGLSSADLDRAAPLRLRLGGSVAAGGRSSGIGPGEAARLFTGAPLAEAIAAVVVEERCREEDGFVTVSVPVSAGANIRRRGEDVAAGDAIVAAGAVIDARHVALLAAAGLRDVTVLRRLRVAILSTGDELTLQGEPLAPGRIYDANRPMLAALLAHPGLEVIDLGCRPDQPAMLAEIVASAAARADMVVTSGGAAGSGTDPIERAVALAGGSLRRWRLALKPGKPLLAGRIGRAVMLGLPGNPVAALVNFLLFGRGLLAALSGRQPRMPAGEPAVAAEPFVHAAGRTEFVPVRVVGRSRDGLPLLEKLGRGGSARLGPLVRADGFAELPREAGDAEAGASIRFHAFQAPFRT